MMRTLLADFGGDGEQLLREAVGVAKVGRHELCWQAVWPDNFMLNPGNRAAYFAGAAPLIPELQRILGAQAPAGRFSEFIFGLWVHAANPQDAAARAFMTQLAPTPAYARLPAAYRRAAADDLHFGPIAKTPAEAATDPAVVSRELLALPATATPAQVEAAFQAVVARASQAAEPVAVHGLQPVAALAEWSGPTRTLARALFRELSPLGAYPPDQGYDDLVFKLVNEARKPGRFGEMAPYAAGFWRAAEATSKGYFPAAAALSGSAEDALAAGERSAALSIARIGLALKGRALSGDARTGGPERVAKLRQVVDKAGLAIGMFEIPVDETDPTYPIYKSNAEFVQGNLDSAWDLFQAHAEDLLRPRPGAEQEPSLIRKLPLAYSFWLLGRTMEGGRTEEAEGLVKELTVWSREAEGIFSPEQDAELKIAYADLAFLKGALPTARAWYRKVADAGEYKGSEAQVRAALGSVKVDRVAKNFGAALEELDQLMRLKDPRFRSRVHYARAEVLMDQENFKDALAEVDAVLRQDPAQADALILRGKIQYQMRKLVEASEIELGVSQASKIMVPGETLKINLVDPTLRISGVSVDIEVEVWAKSGDREVVMLHQLGDDKEKFRAEVPTALAPPVTGDKTLQVLGVDEIRYGYSKRFREKMKDLPPDPDVVIGIASDAHLSLSAGAFPPREGERRLDVEELGLTTAQKALGLRAVRPGNPVYLRVIDPDQSRTAGVDELAVALQTSSGDEIRRLMLKETGPFTGEFEGIVPTAAAQALAFASESAPGRDPNMAISSRDYPGWLGEVGDPEKARTFGVDLNDSVALDRMSIRWGQAGARLTRFVLQTSMNGRDWTTRARYPADPAPWDGRMRASSFPTYNGGIAVSTPRGRDLPADWLEKMELTSARASCRYLAATVTNFPAGRLPMVETGHPGYSGLMQIRALFYQPAKAIRRFRLTGWPAVDGSGSPQTIFLLDGVPADAASDDPLFIERELAPGLHELQIWRHAGWDKITGTRPVLLCDVSGQEDLAPCPDRMFDPASFPPSARAQIPQPARIGEAPDGGLDVVFGASTQARLVRLAIQGFEGVAPAIKSVTLTDRAGTARLPVAGDFMTLRQNAQLEVLPGDTIIARYEDEVTATPRRDRHEQRLQVAFNTASITASFMKYETTPEGRRLLLESIRRFALGDAVAVVIDDADMDGSPAKDAVDFTVAGSGGATTTMKALETEEHSGRFVGRVFPVAGAPARESEIQMNEGGTLTLTYRDVENLDPGIPADRSVTIEHARYVTPQLGVYAVDSVALPGAGNPPRAAAPGKPPAGKESGRMAGPEVVLPRRALNYAYVAETGLAGKPLQGVIGASLRFDVVAPHLALAGSSEIAAYVQVAATNAGPAGAPFDINVPGTLKLAGRPAGAVVAAPAGYKIGHGPTPPSNTPPLEEGRFAFSVPLLLADRPARSFATAEAESLPTSSIPDGLAVRAGDVVRIGYAFKDETGQVQWKTAAVAVGSDAMLDVMNGSYTEPLTRAYVGERIFVRLLAPGLDRGAERDTASVSLRTTNGTAATLPLRETEPHSGVFKGVFALGYADAAPPSPLPPVELNGFPVRYGDEVTVGFEGQACAVAVNRGADGAVEPFSKRFTGDEMAVQTGFTLAECFFELAKQHRQMEQESLARREMAQAQKLLAEAIATHRDDELRAHAEYLLGNLAQEYADLSKNDEAKLPMYQDALARFSKIPVEYPDTEFAPKAQFKTALVYEKMGETEIAVEEYVKLAYKYPDCEYIPEVMSRLGGYFQGKGQAFKEQADPLREKTDVASQGEVLRLDELSYPEFLKAARIFAKLQERFPDHELAGLAGLRAAQNFMRAQQYEDAIARFEKVYTSEQYDGRDIRAQAMFWCGLSYERLAGIAGEGDGKARGHAMNEAYEIYRRVTFDFPDSKWAKSARGRLADPAFEKIIELEELQRERMLESLQREQKRK
jgi:tetratricopeptide (TPR) repeat protein